MNEIDTLTPVDSPETFEFVNATLYLVDEMGMTPRRIDCRRVAVSTGQKYAQYTDAVKVEYYPKGRRTARVIMMGYRPWVRVCRTEHAVTPAESIVPLSDDGNVRTGRSRYLSQDPRWKTDFEDATEHVPWVVAIGAGDRDGDHLARCLAHDKNKQTGVSSNV